MSDYKDHKIKEGGHWCVVPPGTPYSGYGAAVDDCYEDTDGWFQLCNGEYGTPVAFCPFCGAKAPELFGPGGKGGG